LEVWLLGWIWQFCSLSSSLLEEMTEGTGGAECGLGRNQPLHSLLKAGDVKPLSVTMRH